MTANNRKFDDLVNIYINTTFTTNYSVGTIHISTDDLRQCIQDIIDNSDDFGITLESGAIATGEDIIIRITHPKMRIGQLHNTFDDYLKNSKNRIKEASSYYIINDKFYNRDTPPPLHVQKYRAILRLIALFRESSAYLDESNCELVFVDSNVIKIPVNYTTDDLTHLQLDKVKNFIAYFAEDTHRDQKLTILANSIKSMSETKTKDSSFIYLIQDFSQLCESFNKGYKIFVSGFSYDKILDQLRVAKIEEMGKIHKVFSDIQNQILGIPVATIIVATQMKQANGWDAQALINTAIVLGALFFTAMILFVMFNQWQTLNAISDELNYKKNQAETNYKSIYDDIESTFKSLTTRIYTQRVVFIVLGIFVMVGLLLTFKVYYFLTL
ncbi:hypothetical protein [Yersinia intermedia]|uniref:hypothetical protein n=1 Tax=Yersinia intermedia TaxID=631 RepID=UPI0022FE626B|nr:hypothetical protein [Yersinia intermedia]MDA5514155.1 hypothetical protein [Yersinia intermedia]